MGTEEPLIGESILNTGELPKDLRGEYIGFIKNMKPPSGEADRSMRRDLTPLNQSVLYLLRNIEAIRIDKKDRVVEGALDELEKVPLMLRVGKEIGFRPDATSISVDAQRMQNPEGILDDFAKTHPVFFIKANRGYRGEDVFLVMNRDDGKFLVKSGSSNGKENYVVDTLSELSLSPNLYIVEDQINDAPAINSAHTDASWELRHLPPFHSKYDYAKVSSDVAQFLNNISRGGKRKDAKQTVIDVLKRGGSELNSDELEAEAVGYLSRSQQLALKVKELTDRVQVEAAKRIIKADDLKNPPAYEQVMQDCFSGTFLTVDITGVWDTLDRSGKLLPMIMEAQTSAGLWYDLDYLEMVLPGQLPEARNFRLYEETIGALNRKVSSLQAALK